ncbi:Pca regulon regulatory protein [Streptomyces sp. YIM 130001]|uniref:IclR family transcriptional regulator domain-containing protein n=1 Tax=Streptomyces sp. YIM 130001 TaxID=2259644 RepID=UPI000E65A376|nr:IclR family transcriptional regulator C-terminal domain-containing protein [Streptomyces sp. YIM 130001]RII14728.1 Pca regulon regulatory protein [Streptomyces sp. YIM 130001]
MPPTTTAPSGTGRGADPGATLERGLTVLRALAADPSARLGRSALTRTTGLARATVDRITATLIRMGYARPDGSDVQLAPRVLELGNAYLSAERVTDAMRPVVLDLAADLDESVSVCVPDGDGARFVLQCPRQRAMTPAFRVGDLLAVERCAPGALFAAGWDRRRWRAWRSAAAPGAFEARAATARGLGFAVDDQLTEPGLIAVSVPVPGPDGSAARTLNVVSHTSRHTAVELTAHALPRLRRTADALRTVLAGPGGGPPAADATGIRADVELRSAKGELGPDFLQSLARGLAVLRALDVPGGLTLSALAEKVGLARASARRPLLTLQRLGYVDAATDGRFVLLPRVLELGYATVPPLDYEQLVRPHLAALALRLNDSASSAVLDGSDIRYVARVGARRIMSVDLGVGTRLPAYATAMGRVLLGDLERDARTLRLEQMAPRSLTPHTRTSPAAVVDAARRDGYALVDEELEEGLRSIALPVRDAGGRAVAAVNISAHAVQRSAADLRDRVLPELRSAVRHIEADLAAAAGRDPQSLPA